MESFEPDIKPAACDPAQISFGMRQVDGEARAAGLPFPIEQGAIGFEERDGTRVGKLNADAAVGEVRDLTERDLRQVRVAAAVGITAVLPL